MKRIGFLAVSLLLAFVVVAERPVPPRPIAELKAWKPTPEELVLSLPRAPILQGITPRPALTEARKRELLRGVPEQWHALILRAPLMEKIDGPVDFSGFEVYVGMPWHLIPPPSGAEEDTTRGDHRRRAPRAREPRVDEDFSKFFDEFGDEDFADFFDEFGTPWVPDNCVNNVMECAGGALIFCGGHGGLALLAFKAKTEISPEGGRWNCLVQCMDGQKAAAKLCLPGGSGGGGICDCAGDPCKWGSDPCCPGVPPPWCNEGKS